MKDYRDDIFERPEVVNPEVAETLDKAREELREYGFDPDVLDAMDPWDRAELLEDAGLDPWDYGYTDV